MVKLRSRSASPLARSRNSNYLRGYLRSKNKGDRDEIKDAFAVLVS
ncbi:MAG: hypothetical protein ACFCU5_12295 [Pleurocapsa sp.]